MRGKLLKHALLCTGVFLTINAGNVFAAEALMFFDLYWDGHSSTVRGNENVQITVPCEASDFLAQKEYNLDNDAPSPLGNATGVTIKYETNYGNLTELDQIFFKLSNAKFGNLKKCWLVFYEHNGVDTNRDGVGDVDHDANGDGDTDDSLVIAESVGNIRGEREIFFRVTNNGTSYPSNGILYLECAEPDEPPIADNDTFSSPSAQHSNKYNPIIVLDDLYEDNEHYNICPDKIPSVDKKVCLTVRANSGAMNTDLKLPDLSISTPQCFIDMECQFSLNMRPSISVIDMYPVSTGVADCSNSKSGIFKCYDPSYEPGTKFVNVGFTRGTSDNIIYSDSCTDRTAADGTITINRKTDLEDPIKLGYDGWEGKLDIKLYDVRVGAKGDGTTGYACDNVDYSDVKGYKALDFGGNNVYLDGDGNDMTNGPNILFRKGKVCRISGLDVLDAHYVSCSPSTSRICLPSTGNEWVDDIYMGITGNDRLYWVKWGLQEILTIKKDGNTVFTIGLDENARCTTWKCCYENDGTSAYFKKWEPNGTQAFIPHMMNSNLMYVKVANNSCWDAEVYAKVWDEDGDFVDNVYLGVVPAHGGNIFWGNQIFKKAKALNPALGGGYGTFSAILTVGAPKRDVEFAAGDSRDGKGKMLPVYDASFDNDGGYRNKDFDEDYFEQ